MACGEDVKAGGFFAVDIHVQLQAIRLLIAGHVGELRKLTEFLHQFRGPLAQLLGIGILQNVLVLSAADAASICKSCAACMKREIPSTLRVAFAQTFDDFFRVRALVVRFEH